MRFKLDENLPARAVDVLRAAGHDTVSLLDEVAAGAQDADEQRIRVRGESS
jgi:predicted nuclease of predicted toxin-antitoxin system